jgi:hypothetical protein
MMMGKVQAKKKEKKTKIEKIYMPRTIRKLETTMQVKKQQIK